MILEKRTHPFKKITFLLVLFVLASNQADSQDTDSVNITLKELYTLADDNSKAIELAVAGIREAEQNVRIAKTARLPDIHFSASAAYLSDAYIVGLGSMPSGTYESPHFYNSYVLEAAYTVYAGGNIKRAIDISGLQRQITELKRDNTRMDIRLMLTGYYFDLYIVQNQIKVLEKNIEQTNVLLKNMRSRLKAGTLLRSDLIRYELQLSNLEFSLSKARNRKEKLNNRLVQTLDFPQGTHLFAVSPGPGMDPGAAGTGDIDMDRNIDLQIARLQNEVAEKNVALNKAKLLPRVALFASSDFTRPYIYDLPPADIYTDVWLAGLEISFDIGNLYKNRPNVDRAKVQLHESKTNLALTEEKTRIALHDALVDSDEAVEQLSVAHKELELASENYDMVINQYNNQLALITDVMDASNAKLNAELQLENSRTAILFAMCKVKRITGTL